MPHLSQGRDAHTAVLDLHVFLEAHAVAAVLALSPLNDVPHFGVQDWVVELILPIQPPRWAVVADGGLA